MSYWHKLRSPSEGKRPLPRTVLSRTMVSWSCAVGVIALVAACDPGGTPPPVFMDGTGGHNGEGGEGGADPGTGTGGGSSGDPGAPSVEVRSPAADSVLTDTLTAACGVVSDDADEASPVNPDSVKVRLLDDDGEVVLEVPAVAGAADEYVATVSTAESPSGLYAVSCSAADTGVPPLTASASVDVLIDHGPSIEPVTPLADGYLSRDGLHDFEVKIRPVHLFEGDDDAELVGDPMITIDHQEFTLVAKGDDDPDVFIVEGIDFEEEDLFPEPPPDLSSVRVTAENGRSVTGQLDYTVAIDGTGPDVTIVSPAAGTIIGSRVTFVLSIVDDFSGVDWESLIVEAKDTEIHYDASDSRWTLTGDTATLELNTVDYSVATQMAINVSVADIAGNASDNNADSTYFLDQVPPSLSLDPPNVRNIKEDPPEQFFCTHSFDPVGPAAVNDGDDTFNLVQFRALAWDSTNSEPGQTLFYHSAVDPTSIRLWVARADQALVVDTPLPDQVIGDGLCDAISSAVDADVDAVQMFAITPSGTPYFGDGTGDIATPSISGYCNYSAGPVLEPAALCVDDSDMGYAIGQKFGSSAPHPAIYAPLVGGGASCTGAQQSVGALLGAYEGWVCAAVTGEDNAGNTSVSPPIAICLDSPEIVGTPACLGLGTGAAPDCTDGCTPLALPEVFDVGILELN